MLASVVVFVFGFGLVAGGLWDAFETVVLPRRVSRRFRIALIFYVVTWRPYSAMARRIQDATRRETFLSFCIGPPAQASVAARLDRSTTVPSCTSAVRPFSRWVWETSCPPPRSRAC